MDFIGIDGCRAGWFWIGLDASGQHKTGIAKDTDAFAQIAQSAKLVLIDVPSACGTTAMSRPDG